MYDKATALLNQLDEFFADPDIDIHEQDALWSILTALRGPDFLSTLNLKNITTTRIRSLTFPKTKATPDPPADFSVTGHPTSRDKIWDNPHFAQHYEKAMRALSVLRRILPAVKTE